jgi:hypothetical protein
MQGPEAMRQAMADYVRALHQAYLDAVITLPPADRARLPLVAANRITVAAVGARNLHVIGTVEALPAPAGPEVEMVDELDDLAWTLRFFDPVVVPAIGIIDESDAPAYDDVRRALGIRTVVYHLAVPPGGSLTSHHALHAGTGLAMQGADIAGLQHAQVLLAQAIAPGLELPSDASAADVRKALLEAVRAGA